MDKLRACLDKQLENVTIIDTNTFYNIQSRVHIRYKYYFYMQKYEEK